MNETPADRQSQCFLGLLQSLVTSAWIQLGKQKNFMTQTTAVNLEAAAYTIEILEALQARTRGNLTADENRFLEQSLTALRMNFIQVKLPKFFDISEQYELVIIFLIKIQCGF